jgi:hypothetical protein
VSGVRKEIEVLFEHAVAQLIKRATHAQDMMYVNMLNGGTLVDHPSYRKVYRELREALAPFRDEDQ